MNKSFIHRLPYKEQSKDNKQSHLQQVTVHRRCEKTISRSTWLLVLFLWLLRFGQPCKWMAVGESHTHGWRWSLESWLTRWITQPVESPSHWSSCLNTARLQPSIGTRGGVCFYGYQSVGVFWILFPIFWPERVQLVYFTITVELGGHFETGWKINSFKCPLGKIWPFTGSEMPHIVLSYCYSG